jgi:hypothetical protein
MMTIVGCATCDQCCGGGVADFGRLRFVRIAQSLAWPMAAALALISANDAHCCSLLLVVVTAVMKYFLHMRSNLSGGLM